MQVILTQGQIHAPRLGGQQQRHSPFITQNILVSNFYNWLSELGPDP